MKPRAEKPNPWELLGRARKSAYILLRAEELEGGPAGALLALQRYSAEDWRELAVGAGQKPVSEETQAAILAMLEERARCGRVLSRWQWEQLALVGYQEDEVERLELRNCPCGSTHSVPVARVKMEARP